MGFRNAHEIPTRFLMNYFAGLIGSRSIGYFYLSGNVAQDEVLVIGGHTYQFTATGVVTVSSYIAVDVSAGLTVATSVPQLVISINANSASPVNAVALTGDVVAVISDSEGVTPIALSAAGTVNASASAATLADGYAEGSAYEVGDEYTVTAQDVTTWAAGDGVIIGAAEFAGTPRLKNVVIRDANDALLLVTTASCIIQLVQFGTSDLWYIEVVDGAADLSNTDKISWTAVG